jgi:predicted GNAT family N-acyltransferase
VEWFFRTVPRTIISNNEAKLILYNENKLVATSRIVPDGIINAYLCGLGVDSHYRNQRIRTEISRRLVEHCLKNNLHIQLFCEESLVSYYNKAGLENLQLGFG